MRRMVWIPPDNERNRYDTMNEEKDRTLEQVYRSAVKGLYARLRSNYDFLYRRFGDEGLKLIEEMSREYGIRVAERARAHLKDNDLASVAGYLLRIFDTVARGQDLISVSEEDSGRTVIRVRKCPLDFDDPGMCRAHTSMEKAVVEQLNPRLTYTIGKSIPAGDPFCEHIVEFKK